jgi:hypothetical protein
MLTDDPHNFKNLPAYWNWQVRNVSLKIKSTDQHQRFSKTYSKSKTKGFGLSSYK